MNLDLNQLRTFFEATRLGSFTSAAKRLHVTQSAISHAVAKLETSVGRPLIEWRARKLTLSAEGETLYESCSRIFAELDATWERLSGKGTWIRTFRLGAPVEFGTMVLIRKLAPLLVAHPELHLDFFFSHHLIEPLLRDEIDLVLDCRPHLNPDLDRIELFREKYVVVAAPGFLTQQPINTPLELAERPVLSLDKAADWWRNLLFALPEAERPIFKRIVEINHLRGIIHAAEAGLGVGFVPQYAVLTELAAGSLTVLFPDLTLLEDCFTIYQRRAKAQRETNRLVTGFLISLDTSEFGDSIGPVEKSR